MCCLGEFLQKCAEIQVLIQIYEILNRFRFLEHFRHDRSQKLTKSRKASECSHRSESRQVTENGNSRFTENNSICSKPQKSRSHNTDYCAHKNTQKLKKVKISLKKKKSYARYYFRRIILKCMVFAIKICSGLRGFRSALFIF